MIQSDEKYMREALKEGVKAGEKGEIPIGAVVVCKGSVIARAHNLNELLKDPTAHAEMQAITMATEYLGGKYLTSCTIYVTVEPCPMCAAALAWAQVAKVVYGAADPKGDPHASPHRSSTPGLRWCPEYLLRSADSSSPISLKR